MMKFIKDLINFFKAVRAAVRDGYEFEADPNWWLTKNNLAYAAATDERAKSACGFFWTAVWIYPFFVLARRRWKAGLILCMVATVWLLCTAVLLIMRWSLEGSLLIATFLAATAAVTGVITVYSKPITVTVDATPEKPGFKTEFARASWWKKPFVVFAWILIYTMCVIILAIIAIPWFIFTWLKDNQCPFVRYPDRNTY